MSLRSTCINCKESIHLADHPHPEGTGMIWVHSEWGKVKCDPRTLQRLNKKDHGQVATCQDGDDPRVEFDPRRSVGV